MPSQFDLVGEDFRRELDTIRGLLSACSSTTSTAIRVASANASILLLAASYEEFAREVVREFAGALIAGSPPLEVLPPEFPQAIWDRATFILRGSKFGRTSFDAGSARVALTQLSGFCLDEDRGKAIADTVAYNENNLRPGELNTMFKRLGLPDYCQTISASDEILDFFGSPDAPSSHGRMLALINEFYDARNEVAHSLGSLRTTGVTNLDRYLDFFKCFADAIVDDLAARTAPHAS